MNISDIPTEEYSGIRFSVERMADCLERGETQTLNAAHWEETEGYRHSQGMNVNYPSYVAMERNGQLMYFTARRDGRLVGHIVYIVHVNRHSSKLTAVEDFFFVSKEARGAGAGRALLRYAVSVLTACGCKQIGMSEKLTHPIGELLRSEGFQHVANFHVLNVE